MNQKTKRVGIELPIITTEDLDLNSINIRYLTINVLPNSNRESNGSGYNKKISVKLVIKHSFLM